MSEKSSVKKRYVITLFVNITRFMLTIISATIIPKTLGPSDYGSFRFLGDAFAKIRGALDIGTKAAFFTYASKHEKSGNAFFLYFGWLCFQAVLITIFLIYTFIFEQQSFFFPDQAWKFIILMAVFDWLNMLAQFFVEFGETKAETLKVQKVNLASIVLKFALTIILWAYDILNFYNLIMIFYFASFVTIFPITLNLMIKKYSEYFEKISFKKIKDLFPYYYSYMKPMFIYQIYGLVVGYFDRWFLQKKAGSIEQGYFALAFQLTLFAQVFSQSMINIFWREISKYLNDSDTEKAIKLYFKVSNVLFSLTAIISFYAFLQADNLVSIFLGDKYLNAIKPILILAFVPLFASLSTLNASIFFAMNEMRLYRNTSISLNLLGMLLAYLLLSYDMMSIGLSMKVLIMSIVISLTQIYYISKIWSFNLKEFFYPKIRITFIFIIISIPAYIVSIFFQTPVWNIVFFSLLFFILIAIIFNRFHDYFGINGEEISSVKNKILSILKLR